MADLRILLGGVHLLDNMGQYGHGAKEHTATSKTPFGEGWGAIPIGLLYIASAQRSLGNTKCDYRLFNFDVPVGEQFSLERVFSSFESTLNDFQPDIIALGCLTARQIPYLEKAIKISRKYLAKNQPDGHILIGGKPASNEPKRFLECGANIVCIGEGEITFTELIDTLANGGDISKVNGIMFRGANGNFHQPPERPLVSNLDSLPIPAWDLADMSAIKKMNKGIFCPIVTSRGCPFGCIYCDSNKTYRPHSPERVTDEIEHLITKYNFKGIEIVDEVFNCQKKRVLGIRDEFKRRNIQTELYNFDGIRGDIADEETVEALYEMGMRGLSVAIESGTPRLQKMIGKRLNIDRALKTISMADQRGIIVNAFFMIGFPTETRKEIETTIALARDCAADRVTIAKVEYYPGTALFELAVQKGLNPEQYKSEKSERFGIRKDTGTLEVTEKELHEIQEEGLFNAYNHVPRMERICRKLSPIFFSQMYKKFYQDHGIWTKDFAAFFAKATSSHPVDFEGLTKQANEVKKHVVIK